MGADKNPDKIRNRQSLTFRAIIAGIVVFIIAAAMFYLIGSDYRDKTKLESGLHLLETGKQVAMFLNDRFANDRMIADSVSKSIVSSNYTDNDDVFLTILRDQQEAWNVTDLMLYTEDGYCCYADGEIVASGDASVTIATAHRDGSVSSIIDSTITYTLPIKTEQIFHGSRITAISVVRNMETLMDELDFTSYDNEACMYLTETSGIVISMLSSKNAIFTFNVATLFENNRITQLSDADTPQEIMSVNEAAAFYMSDGAEDKYVVSIPISSASPDNVNMRLFYIVPETVANDTSNGFSKRLTNFSVVILGLLLVLTFIVFYALYKISEQQFDTAIMAREQMFDLLIQNIRTVFGLFDVNKIEPVYLSANVVDVLGDYWIIVRDDDGYHFRAHSSNETDLLRQVNEQMRSWDGKSVFRSGYLCNSTTVPPTYYEVVLYPVGSTGEDFVGILQDVTLAHEREEATKSAMEMAKQSDRAKTRFLANMSHDIRTPMNAIMNMSSFALESTGEPEKQAEYLKTIYESSDHLLHLINDVLDMSRVESGQTVIVSEPFDIKTELQKLAETIKPLCAEKNQTFITDFSGLRSGAVCGDALKISQILINLLSNAVKFTPNGGKVRFRAKELQSLKDGIVSIRFVVADNGIGISADDKRHIFEPFMRADDKRIRTTEGTGLGLSICKSYAEAMGGSIRCDSEQGKGSTFTVELFFKKAAVEVKEKVDTNKYNDVSFAGKRCLVVEDVLTNQAIARRLLERVGFAVDVAGDGGEGARRFLNSEQGTYDIIYMDIQMPVMDGYEATEMIRQSSHPQAKTIYILAMSANVFVEDIEKARIAGMDGYVGKPIVPKDLIEKTITAFQTEKG